MIDTKQVKAVLDLYKVPYATLDVNPLTKVRPSLRVSVRVWI